MGSTVGSKQGAIPYSKITQLKVWSTQGALLSVFTMAQELERPRTGGVVPGLSSALMSMC